MNIIEPEPAAVTTSHENEEETDYELESIYLGAALFCFDLFWAFVAAVVLKCLF